MKLRGSKPATSDRRRPGGGTSPAMFSYYARGSSPSSQNTGRREEKPASKPKRSIDLGNLPTILSFLVIIGALVYVSTLQATPRIILVNQPDSIHRDAKTYQAGIKAIWQRSILNRSKLTVSTSSIRSEIERTYGELAFVDVELPLVSRRPTIIVTPAAPILQLIASNGAFYIDADGKVMARVEDVTGNQLPDIPTVQDQTGTKAEIGKPIIAGDQAAFLSKLAAQLNAENLPVQSITLPASAANEADLRLNGVGYYIKFSLDSDPRQAVGSYLAARDKLAAEGITPAEYLDARVEEKVFYK